MKLFFAFIFLLLGILSKLIIDPIITIHGDFSAIHNFFFLLSGIFFILGIKSMLINTEKEEETWNCENCKIELYRDEIKFGSCPRCGKKIKHFRGLQHTMLK